MTRATLSRMNLGRTRLAVVLVGDRLYGAVVRGAEVKTIVVESEQPALALRAELDALRVSPRGVAIGVPRSVVTVKPVTLPPVGDDMREMVRFELERHLPFAAEDTPFDFIALPDPAEAVEGRRVLVTAADRRVVDAAVRLAQEAKLRPRSVTVAAHDLVSLARMPSRGRIVWIHRVEDTIDLLFVSDGRVALSRTLAASDDATLVTEIRRSFGVALWRGCDAVWVSGDSAAPVTLQNSPFAALNVPVTAPSYTGAARRALAGLESGSRGAFELAIAVALAPSDRSLDLLPPALKPFRLSRAQMLTAAVALATAALVIVALMVPGYRDGRRLAALNGDIAALDREVRAVEAMLRDLDGKRRLVSTIDGLEASAIRPLPVLRELTDLLPNDTWLTLVSLEAKGVELTGQANAASALIPLLENSSRFERVEFASPVTRGRDREQFRIQAAWEPRAADAARAPPAASPAGQPAQRPARRR
jgi:Tfp pilus assembly protein PilN